MRDLPVSWAYSTLGQVCDSGQYGWTTSATTQGQVRFLRTTDITKRSIEWGSVPFCVEVPKDLGRYLVSANDIVVSRAGSVGFSKLLPEVPSPTVFASYLIRFKTTFAVEPRYVAAYLRSPEYWRDIGKASAGIALANVNATKLAALPMPLAPLQEQKRIADKLDTVLARVEACRDRLARISPLLKRFRQAVLAAATSGRLTEEWRLSSDCDVLAAHAPMSIGPNKAAPLPPNWAWTSMASLCTKIADGVHKKPNYVATGVPFLTVKNLTAGPGISFKESSYVTREDHEAFCRRTHPERDDILITKDGTLGVIRRIETDDEFSIFVSLALVKLKDRRQSKYVTYALMSPVMQAQMAGVGTGLQHIHLTDLRQDLLPVPPLEEQSEIVRRVESLFALVDRLEARLAQAQTAVDRLTPSLLAKAFRGELVPQDSADEPAAELLRRLATEREAAPARRRQRTSA